MRMQTAAPERPAPVCSQSDAGQDYTWALLILVLLATIALRLHLLQVPLDRDEGEYAYAGQMILQGYLPYLSVYNMKMPGVYGAYALAMAVFGQTITGIHLALLLVNLATIVLLYLLGKRLVDPVTGLVAAMSFAVFSLGQGLQGLSANAEAFVILPAVAGLYLLLRAAETPRPFRLFVSGLLFGLAFLMKQHGAAYILFAVTYLAYQGLSASPRRLRRLLTNQFRFLAGAVLPFALTCLFFFAAGVFARFWFWTFTYAKEYASMVSPSLAWQIFQESFHHVVASAPLLWVLAGWGLLALLIDRRARARLFFIGALVIFSFLAIAPGFYFRPHYFVLLLPAASLLVGVGISALGRLLAPLGRLPARLLPAALILCVLVASVYPHRHYLFGVTPAQASRLTYGGNPFPESLKIAHYLRLHTTPADTIAVLGSEPQIYFYAHRRAATGYIYMFPLMESHPYALRMQQEMIREIEASRPAYLVYVDISSSWLTDPGAPDLIFDWFRKYRRKFYDCVGVIEIGSPGPTVYHWGKAGVGYQPSTPSVYVFKRKSR
jgi:hypothetical protein